MAMDSHMPSQDNIQERLKTAQEECQRLREENAHLRAMLGIDRSATNEPASQAVLVPKLSSTGTSEVSTPEKKIALFRNLFRGREDVFAIRWEGKGGKSGYSPAGGMDWRGPPAPEPEDCKKVGGHKRGHPPLSHVWV